MKTIIFLTLLLLFALAPGWSPGSSGQEGSWSAAAAAPAPALAVESARIEVRNLERTVEAIGTLGPNEEVTIRNQVEGLVAKVFVDLGDFVQAGQLLAQLDTSELDLAVRQQSAALQQEMARLGVTDPNARIDQYTTAM